MLRLGAVSVASVFFTMSAVGATYADDNGGNGNSGNDGKAAATAAPQAAQGSGNHGQESHGDHGQQGRESHGDHGPSQAAASSHGDHGHRHPSRPEQNGNGSVRGNGHTPVTVCHRLGNGGYIPLTFDDNALKAHLAHGDLYPMPADGCPSTTASAPGTDTREHGNGSVHGNGHTPVTVCHLLGNGGYIPLTFDDNALEAHLAHGDLYPMPADGCPSTATAAPSVQTSAGDLSAGQQVLTAGAEIQKVLMSSQEILTGTSPRPATVLGTEATRTVRQSAVRSAAGSAAVRGDTAVRSRTAARVAPAAAADQVQPAAGLLPNTGAAASLGAALLAGLGLVAGGVVMLTRKRGLTGR